VEKDAVLLRAIRGDGAHLRAELPRRSGRTPSAVPRPATGGAQWWPQRHNM